MPAEKGANYKASPVALYLQKYLSMKGYGSFARFGDDYNLDVVLLRKYIRGDVKFELHYFMVLVEALELNVAEFYGLVYQQDVDRGRI
ncbi:hypothetical protein UFOVP219_10 [uncultured Caudovirales phage]|uniref:Uncharacterized protein n=1 Tax=uncultured Caudovirales phage TaxID=2100421 RepID=A0A6J7WQI4_9CAUD|nr:hypothetical protein UFOVP219_10 [uncultured Caudovirales phage]